MTFGDLNCIYLSIVVSLVFRPTKHLWDFPIIRHEKAIILNADCTKPTGDICKESNKKIENTVSKPTRNPDGHASD